MVYMCTKFHEHILNGFRVMERTQFQYFFIIKGHNSVNIAHRVIVFFSAQHLIMVYIYSKFHENILNGFRVMERT